MEEKKTSGLIGEDVKALPLGQLLYVLHELGFLLIGSILTLDRAEYIFLTTRIQRIEIPGSIQFIQSDIQFEKLRLDVAKTGQGILVFAAEMLQHFCGRLQDWG